ncbi:32634_t:CDS:2, partial [Gigaspora margarita]
SVLENNQIPARTQQDRQIRILIADEDSWDNISVLAEVFRPIVKCITMFENDSATLSLVYKEMADIKNLECNITSPIQDSVIDIITKQFNYMQTSIMLLAYLLDGHFYPHHHFHPTEYGELVALLDTNITLQEVAKDLHPQNWWTYGFSFQFLQPFCTQIFAMPTSSASSKHNWSVHSHIHTKKRNRLTNKHLEELVYIYWNLQDVENESVWSLDIEQEVDDDENNFWKGFDELTDQVLYDIE